MVEPGQIKRSTLQEKLAEGGYSVRHMRMYADTGTAARRYQKKYRNQLSVYRWSAGRNQSENTPIV